MREFEKMIQRKEEFLKKCEERNVGSNLTPFPNFPDNYISQEVMEEYRNWHGYEEDELQ